MSIAIDSSYDPSTGALTVSNGATVDVLHFMGSYSQANFEFASDAHGGTVVYDPPASTQGTPAGHLTVLMYTSPVTVQSMGLGRSMVDK